MEFDHISLQQAVLEKNYKFTKCLNMYMEDFEIFFDMIYLFVTINKYIKWLLETFQCNIAIGQNVCTLKINNFPLLEPMIFCSLNDFATYYDELLFKS